jgi:hypothetical protein
VFESKAFWEVWHEKHQASGQAECHSLGNFWLDTFFWAGAEPSLVVLRTFIGLLYQPWMIDDDDWGAIGGMND